MPFECAFGASMLLRKNPSVLDPLSSATHLHPFIIKIHFKSGHALCLGMYDHQKKHSPKFDLLSLYLSSDHSTFKSQLSIYYVRVCLKFSKQRHQAESSFFPTTVLAHCEI
jgi:hypothetical protein